MSTHQLALLSASQHSKYPTLSVPTRITRDDFLLELDGLTYYNYVCFRGRRDVTREWYSEVVVSDQTAKNS